MEGNIFMAKQESNQRIGTGINSKVTAVIPAYNEAPRLGAVLKVLKSYPHFQEIIVVDDGSTDNTSELAKKYGARVIRNPGNMGKGYAMDRGVKLALENGSDVIFFSDADITGLTPEMIQEIVAPVARGELDMFIGMTDREWYFVHELLAFIPLLGGERAITVDLWQKVPDYYKQHFRIEVALNFFSVYYGKGYQYKILPGVSQTIKEEKYGFWNGALARIKMFYNLFSAQVKLNIYHRPHKWSSLFYGFRYKYKNGHKTKRG